MAEERSFDLSPESNRLLNFVFLVVYLVCTAIAKIFVHWYCSSHYPTTQLWEWLIAGTLVLVVAITLITVGNFRNSRRIKNGGN
jgi:hypothetical protein